MDLTSRYHKRPDLADALVRAVQRLRKAQQSPRRPRRSVQSTGRSERQWRVTDRLDAAAIRLICEAAAKGVSKPALAKQYGVSLSSIQRLVKREEQHQFDGS
ncbi:hypothetical protein VA596_04235 [Amycolatopsis sp., V23-08]|uniref:HTH psq-type domain-containing protein n=1 Tax=Amycolatopsis heterodermiae TaxID=3110235 RepID=A0ABU5QXS8_9PSEU|nr:hypothetical protein [Amycolatopsis sp., V23-08]MEA5358733.1 hypothetical protein [Amycolatopsis sp., V23-08]